VPVGTLDINLYRDDLSTVSQQPVLNATDIPFPVTGQDVILMDDVLYTGARSAPPSMHCLIKRRASRVQLLVADRSRLGRELPIEVVTWAGWCRRQRRDY